MKTLFTALLLCILSISPSYGEQAEVQGGQFKNLGHWQVHYIAFPSTSVPAEVARNYDLERAGDRALINISVLQNNQAQAVNIQGSAKNLIGQTEQLTFKEIKEGESIYYIAQMRFDNEEVYRFEITLTQGNTVEVLRFHQKLYEH
ncbi:DUF4426 domain-containing protein [Pseudoalteromonas ruthenica]|uniref:DUF4426 domain-containing protein n=1 Tax=Pseudoalteromonas ruthenica TaxID=151081 RepID=A0A0F4PQL4_9GAMM|nr:DUF4426 domain-containing protein [Pseudoalteromonas ruthenica]KJY96536.1 hypothetical protein TW76_10710 [Pseudoalteromonas ruthenica]KJY98407.1 hypothetical protein TW72_11725 [Pseudoalteromonas ruthenica]TMO89542.1 DUF4426 domain-containing protein [Pseudoalteromonas ruthenica]TMO94022.1 DUF4426 domain-containing protein [Pseudoalteromonas ruthenica]TMO98266.1 DUF4426 domain-containing protein [Pseudoalteromonas ruthenica]